MENNKTYHFRWKTAAHCSPDVSLIHLPTFNLCSSLCIQPRLRAWSFDKSDRTSDLAVELWRNAVFFCLRILGLVLSKIFLHFFWWLNLDSCRALRFRIAGWGRYLNWTWLWIWTLCMPEVFQCRPVTYSSRHVQSVVTRTRVQRWSCCKNTLWKFQLFNFLTKNPRPWLTWRKRITNPQTGQGCLKKLGKPS